jgi:hypothetical protein
VKKISSGFTIFNKRVFPLVWFGFLAIFVLTALSGLSKRGRVIDALPFLIGPAVMGLFGFFMMRTLIWSLADEVYDCGDFLLVKNNGQEESIALSNIMNVGASLMMNPPRITLRLAQPGVFGKEVAFLPARSFSLNPFKQEPLVEDLIVRVDRARSKRPSR